MSDANKLLIRCACSDADSLPFLAREAFAFAGYTSNWVSGSCSAYFTAYFRLKTAVRAFNNNAAGAIAEYGPIADWDVSAVSDMIQLFYRFVNFNADVSNWDTSSVTTMYQMFSVRSALCPAPNLSRALPCTLDAIAPVCWPAPCTASYAPLSTLGRARRRSTSR